MEGRLPKGGVFTAFVNCSDPSREAEMNDWYNTVHAPDVTRSGIFRDFTRYVNPNAKGTPEDPKYLAVYESDGQDMVQAAEAFRADRGQFRRWSAESRLHPALSLASLGYFKSHGNSPICPGGKRTKGVLAVLTDCADVARVDEFDKWYDTVHIPEIIGTGCYWGAARYRNITVSSQEPQYMALYETDGPGPETLARLASLNATTRRPEIVRVRFLGAFNLLYSQATDGQGRQPTETV